MSTPLPKVPMRYNSTRVLQRNQWVYWTWLESDGWGVTGRSIGGCPYSCLQGRDVMVALPWLCRWKPSPSSFPTLSVSLSHNTTCNKGWEGWVNTQVGILWPTLPLPSMRGILTVNRSSRGDLFLTGPGEILKMVAVWPQGQSYTTLMNKNLWAWEPANIGPFSSQ